MFKKNNKSLINQLLSINTYIFILIIFFNINVFSQQNSYYNSIQYYIGDIKNINPDFEYNYLSNMITDIIKKTLTEKKIKLDKKLKEDYYKGLLYYYTYLSNNETDYYVPVKIIEKNILDSEIFNLNYSENYFILINIDYEVVTDNNIKYLVIKIKEKYKNYNETKNFVDNNFNLITYRTFDYKIEYNSFSIYDDLNKLFQKKFLNDFLNISYFKLVVKSKKNYYLKVNDIIVGPTNKEYYLEEGNKEIEVFLPGYKSKKINLNLIKDSTLDIELEKKIGNVTLLINTFPQNSEVWIDNKFIGYSPIKVENLDPGTHFISIIKEGFIVREKVVNVEKGQISNLEIYLFPLNSIKYYNNYANYYLNSGYKKAFISGVFAGLGIASGILYNEFYLNYKYNNNKLYYYLSNGMVFTTFVFTTISLYKLYDAIITLNKYTSIKENYNPIK